MTSTGRLFVPLLFNFRLPTLRINGHRTRERRSLSAEASRASPRWPFPWLLLPPSIVTLSDAQIAKIKG
jgi:hypothetical protein